MTLYEITEDITKESEEAVTIKEASKRLNRTVGSLYKRQILSKSRRPNPQQKQRPEPASGV